MENTALIKMLKHCSKKDMKNIEKFLQSPYHNTTENYVILFQTLRQYYPNFNSPELHNNNIIIRQAFPKKTPTSGVFANMKHGLLKSIRTYLAIERLKEDELLMEQLMTEALCQRSYTKEFVKKSEEIVEKLKKHKDVEAFHTLSILNAKLFANPGAFVANKNDYLTASAINIDKYYILNKLIFSLEQINRGELDQHKNQVLSHEQILKSGAIIFEGHNILFNIYSLALRIELDALTNAYNKQNYRNLKTMIENHADLLSRPQQMTMFTILSNFASKQYHLSKNSGEDLEEMFDIYKKREERDLYVENEQICPLAFSNAITVSIRCKEQEWAKEFKKKYSKLLPKNLKAFIMDLANAELNSSDEDSKSKNAKFQESLNLLLKIDRKKLGHMKKKERLFCNLKIQELEIKLLYELFCSDQTLYRPASYKLKTLKNFIHNKKKLAVSYKRSYLNFKKVVKYLLDRKKDKAKILAFIKEKEYLVSREWLMEKVQDYKSLSSQKKDPT